MRRAVEYPLSSCSCDSFLQTVHILPEHISDNFSSFSFMQYKLRAIHAHEPEPEPDHSRCALKQATCKQPSNPAHTPQRHPTKLPSHEHISTCKKRTLPLISQTPHVSASQPLSSRSNSPRTPKDLPSSPPQHNAQSYRSSL